MLFGEAVPVRNEGAPSIEVELRLATEEFDAQILRKERPAPAIVIAAHERDRDAPGADLLQLGDRGKMFARDDGLILEPEIEEITCQNEVIAGLGDLLEKRVERCADGRRHLTQMRVRHDDHTSVFVRGRHGPSLGTWNGARKHITVVP